MEAPLSEFVSINSTLHEKPVSEEWEFQDPIQRTIISVIIFAVTVVGLSGNSLVVLAVVLSKTLQNRTNVFVVNLALADFLTCLVLPFQAVSLLHDSWPFPDHFCTMVGTIMWEGLGTSLINLALIAFMRFSITTKPRPSSRLPSSEDSENSLEESENSLEESENHLEESENHLQESENNLEESENYFDKPKMALMVVGAWLVPFLLIVVPPLFDIGRIAYSPRYKICSGDSTHPKSDMYTSLTNGIVVCPCLIVIIVCYSKIYLFFRTSSRDFIVFVRTSMKMTPRPNLPQNRMEEAVFKRHQKVTKNLFVVVCSFLICTVPGAIVSIIPGPTYPAIPWTAMIVTFNSCVNPIIYGLKHPEFKIVFRPILTCSWRNIPEPSFICRRNERGMS